MKGKEGGLLARALYNNLSVETSNELYFKKGDILTVIEFDSDEQKGWWLCVLRGQRGLCPGNYLELVDDKFSLPSEEKEIERISSDSGLSDPIENYDVPRSHISRADELRRIETSASGSDLYDVPRSSLSVIDDKRKRDSGFSYTSQGSSLLFSSSSDSSSSSSDQNIHNPLIKRESSITISSSELADSVSRASINSNSYCTPNFIKLGDNNFDVVDGQIIDDDIPNYENVDSKTEPKVNKMMSLAESQCSVDLYDVPRSSLQLEDTSLKNDDTYDVPRSVRSFAEKFEKKYDAVPTRRNHNGFGAFPSTSVPNVAKLNREGKYFDNGLFKGFEGENTSRFLNDNSKRNNSLDASTSLTCYKSMRNIPSSNEYPDKILKKGHSIHLDPSEDYDVPRSYLKKVQCTQPTQQQQELTERRESLKSRESLKESDNFFINNIKRGSQTLQSHDSTDTLSNEEFGSSENSLYREASTLSLNKAELEVKWLPLSPKSAVSICEKLRKEVMISENSLHELARDRRWRSKEVLTETMPDIRFNSVRLNLAIKDFADFTARTIFNARKFGEEELVGKLKRLHIPLTNGSQIIQRSVDELEAYFWSVDRFSLDERRASGPFSSSTLSLGPSAPDVLDQLTLCARTLKGDVTESSNFIALNSSAIFKFEDERPQPDSVVEKGEFGCEDYDYVSLVPVSNPIKREERNENQIDNRDDQLIEFYSAQIGSIAPLLSSSISTFISSLHLNEPPKVFNGHLKFVLLFSYKMLFSGDTIHRNMRSRPLIKEEIERKANELHKAVLGLHDASKIATRDFPRIPPMQEIIEKVWETTAAATNLKKSVFKYVYHS